MISGELVVRKARQEDIAIVDGYVRDEDKKEIIAAGFKTTRQALEFSYKNSSAAFTIEVPSGLPVAIFGVVPKGSLVGGKACVWLIGAEGLSRFKKSFARQSRAMIGNLLSLYPVLENHVDVRYTKTIRWLKWCGAVFDAPEPYGPEGLLFRRFEIRRA